MSQFTKMGFGVASLVIFLGIAGCGSDEKELILTPQQEKEIAERLTPIGEVVLQKDIATSVPAIVSTVSAPNVELSEVSAHVIKMFNTGSGGIMVFAPAVMKVSTGDTILFKATDMSHTSVSTDGLIAAADSSWAGLLNQDITVQLLREGL